MKEDKLINRIFIGMMMFCVVAAALILVAVRA